MFENLKEFPGLENFDAYDEKVVVLLGVDVKVLLAGGITVVARL